MFLLLLQLPTEPPGSFEVLQWVMVGMLTTALVYVFRQCQKERRNCVQKDRETIERLLEALKDHVHEDHLDITNTDE
jgi:hypothetical protein